MMNPAYNTYRVFVPAQAVGANLIYFDLFNPTTSPWQLDVYSVIPIVSGAVAVTGVVAVDLFLNRTSAVGTGGTAMTFNGTSFTAMTLAKMTGAGQDVTEISGRLTPTGGATAGAAIAGCSVFSEETNAGTYLAGGGFIDLVRRGHDDCPPMMVQQGSGLSVVQGSVASVGNIGFDVIFQARPKG